MIVSGGMGGGGAGGGSLTVGRSHVIVRAAAVVIGRRSGRLQGGGRGRARLRILRPQNGLKPFEIDAYVSSTNTSFLGAWDQVSGRANE